MNTKLKLERIEFLDGFRGIAILLVLGFHAYSRWPEILPFGDSFQEFPLFKFGYLGVHLFFLISGFVILMTLEKCSGFFDFMFRRWLRLFPAMLICSLVVFITAPLFFERPLGQPGFADLIPGLLFIESDMLNRFSPFPINELEGAFWSLYVEAKFYVIAGLIFFPFREKVLTVTLFGFFIVNFCLEILYQASGNNLVYMAYRITDLLSLNYFGWFAAGCAFFQYSKNGEKAWFIAGVSMTIASCLVESRLDIAALIAALSITLLFCATIISTTLQKLFSHRVFVFFGFISYPLYLLHENMMIATIIKIDPYTSFIPNGLLPVIAITFVSIIAYVISRYIESPVKHSLRNNLMRARGVLFSLPKR